MEVYQIMAVSRSNPPGIIWFESESSARDFYDKIIVQHPKTEYVLRRFTRLHDGPPTEHGFDTVPGSDVILAERRIAEPAQPRACRIV